MYGFEDNAGDLSSILVVARRGHFFEPIRLWRNHDVLGLQRRGAAPGGESRP